MAITSVRISDLTKQAVSELAEREGRTAHAFILEAIEEKVVLTRQRQAFLDEGRAALHEIRAGGRTVSLEDMTTWLRARARSEEVAPPQGA